MPKIGQAQSRFVSMHSHPDIVLRATRAWLEKAVIGLNLCPFARSVYSRGQVHFSVSDARDANALHAELKSELEQLAQADPGMRDTTLLIVPDCLNDFLDFNDYLGEADDLLEELELDGIIQIASFHPQYQFAGTTAGDVTNCTNRSPYPTLHLLRESSIERAVEGYGDTDTIFGRNIETLRRLGAEGWKALGVATPADDKASP
jgi:hypothetical protein